MMSSLSTPSTNNGLHWNFFGQLVPRSEIVYFAQITVCSLVILASILNISLNNGNTEMWVSFFGYALGAILPPPKMKNPLKKILAHAQTPASNDMLLRQISSSSSSSNPWYPLTTTTSPSIPSTTTTTTMTTSMTAPTTVANNVTTTTWISRPLPSVSSVKPKLTHTTHSHAEFRRKSLEMPYEVISSPPTQ